MKIKKILFVHCSLSFAPCLLPLAFCLFYTPLSMSAQNALGCNGVRYSADVFTDTTMTTLRYGVNNVGSTVQQLYLDLVQPKNDTLSRRPLIIWAYGGGFVTGVRKDMSAFCDIYAKKGYVTATIDYRLYSFANGFPDSVKITNTIIQAVQDMKASIRYLKKTVKEEGNPYRIDTSNIIVGGISAGAITALLTAQMDSTDPIPTWMRTIIAAQGGFEGNSGTPCIYINGERGYQYEWRYVPQRMARQGRLAVCGLSRHGRRDSGLWLRYKCLWFLWRWRWLARPTGC